MNVEHAENGLHRSGFAGAIGADDHGNLTGVHRDGAVVQNIGAPAIAAGHRLADQEGFGHSAAPLFFSPVPR